VRAYRAPVREFGLKAVRLTDSGERDVLLSTFATGDRVFQ